MRNWNGSRGDTKRFWGRSVDGRELCDNDFSLVQDGNRSGQVVDVAMKDFLEERSWNRVILRVKVIGLVFAPAERRRLVVVTEGNSGHLHTINDDGDVHSVSGVWCPTLFGLSLSFHQRAGVGRGFGRHLGRDPDGLALAVSENKLEGLDALEEAATVLVVQEFKRELHWNIFSHHRLELDVQVLADLQVPSFIPGHTHVLWRAVVVRAAQKQDTDARTVSQRRPWSCSFQNFGFHSSFLLLLHGCMPPSVYKVLVWPLAPSFFSSFLCVSPEDDLCLCAFGSKKNGLSLFDHGLWFLLLLVVAWGCWTSCESKPRVLQEQSIK